MITLTLSWQTYNKALGEHGVNHWATQMGPAATSCGADLVAGVNSLRYGTFEEAQKAHDKMVKDLTGPSNGGWQRVYVIGYITDKASLAVAKKLGWKHLDTYRSCHGTHDVYTVAFSTTWEEKPAPGITFTKPGTEVPLKKKVEKDDGKGHVVVVKKHAKTPIAKAVEGVKLAVVKTKRAVTRKIKQEISA